MNVLVTGGAGFIGSNLVASLVFNRHRVKIIDNLSTGFYRHVSELESTGMLQFVEGDLLSAEFTRESISDVDVVVHLAANADVRFGWDHPLIDTSQNLVVTQNVLEAMRQNGIRRMIFSSTGSVYNDSVAVPTPEISATSRQHSLYGASKIAAEALISAYSEAGYISATIFRFVSVLGPNYSHGHVFDFVKQLSSNRDKLLVLGDGSQRKSYLHVSDCVSAIESQIGLNPSFEVYNLGIDDYCTVRDSANWIISEMGLSPEIITSQAKTGWVGDLPFIYLDTSKIRSTGWYTTRSIEESVRATVRWLLENDWILAARE